MARNERASCCIVTIAAGIGFDVTVVQNGRRLPRQAHTHDPAAKTMQEIIPHYHALGIDRFAYMGHGCLKASVTTACRLPEHHYITMYAVVATSRAMTIDRIAQLLGRFNTDMGDFRFPRRHNTWLLTNEGVVTHLQSYRNFELNVYRHWRPARTLGRILARCQRGAPELSEATVGARKRPFGEMEALPPAEGEAGRRWARAAAAAPGPAGGAAPEPEAAAPAPLAERSGRAEGMAAARAIAAAEEEADARAQAEVYGSARGFLGGDRWRVERLLGRQQVASGAWEYLVRWQGWQQDDTWEAEGRISRDLVGAFDAANPR